MSDAIARLKAYVNKTSDCCSRGLECQVDTSKNLIYSNRDRKIEPRSESKPDKISSEIRDSGQNNTQSISSYARELRLASAPPARDASCKRQWRAPLRIRDGRRTPWLNAAICEAERIIGRAGKIYDLAEFQYLFAPVAALHIMRERARGSSSSSVDAIAIGQLRRLVAGDLHQWCEEWLRERLGNLRAMTKYQLWRAAGSRLRRGGCKELGVALGRHFFLTRVDRQRLAVRMIRSAEVTEAERRKSKRNADRDRAAAKRRAARIAPRNSADAIVSMMRDTGLSRASCYRRLKSMKANEVATGPEEHEGHRSPARIVNLGRANGAVLATPLVECICP